MAQKAKPALKGHPVTAGPCMDRSIENRRPRIPTRCVRAASCGDNLHREVPFALVKDYRRTLPDDAEGIQFHTAVAPTDIGLPESQGNIAYWYEGTPENSLSSHSKASSVLSFSLASRAFSAPCRPY